MTFNLHTQLLQSSVPLYRINKQLLPDRHASGCLIDYHQHRVLLTVEHAVRKGEQWSIQMRYEPEEAGTQMWRFWNTLNFLRKQSLTTGDVRVQQLPVALVSSRKDAPRSALRMIRLTECM